jgi:hypothetical protein
MRSRVQSHPWRSDIAPLTLSGVIDAAAAQSGLEIDRTETLEDVPMRVSRLSIGAAVIAAVLHSSAVSVAAQSAVESEPVLKSVKERNGKTQAPEAVVNAGMTKQQRLSLCLGSWDAETHMSKQEWRVACQRTVRDYPDAFVR